VNEKHLALCSGAEWAEAVRRWIVPWVLDGLDLGDSVLELGPGPGRTTEVLCGLVPRLTAVEIDQSLAASLATRLTPAGVQVVQGDATALPYDDGSFSAVLSFTMLHHLPSAADQDRLLREAARVLRPGGVLAGTDSLDSEEFRELHTGDICVPVEPAGLAARLKTAGFGQTEVETNDYGVRFRAWIAAPPAQP
jgi:ubiquinone/menaquinone biosynthesis C-methylase UbiE